ncbi:hypothetical protein SNE40_023283 [Patella caerulea]|uniref:Uncharacterized protein n=1 Tax=Patella caerulea TaxID=87958 RepID=A0AAN8G2Q2_PATCE
MFAAFQCSGSTPSSTDFLYNLDNGNFKTSASSFRTLGCKLSGPGDFVVLSFSSLLLTRSGDISISSRMGDDAISTVGRLIVFSFEKTPQKKLFNSTAFSKLL